MKSLSKGILLTIFLFSIFLNTINAQTDTCRICGNWKWEKNDAQTFFTLKIKLTNISRQPKKIISELFIKKIICSLK